ncbi:MAG: nitroreductase family protein [Ilumatobacteraceae bacterium]
MTEFDDVVRRRRMTRAFSDRPVPSELLDELLALACRAPSAGKSQGWHFVVLEGDETSRFWDTTLPPERRSTFAWPGLLRAPVIVLPFADPAAYVERYAEPDKAGTGLGAGVAAWPVPYWTVDVSMAVMTLLLGAEDRGLGALFFGVFRGAEDLVTRLGIPEHVELIGAVALGYRDEALDVRPGRSATRPRRGLGDVVHRGGW